MTGNGDSIICNNIQVFTNYNYCLIFIKKKKNYNFCAGQHLITAIFEQDYHFNTTTWNLGAETSFIELDTKAVTVEQLRDAEAKINLIIALGRPVSVINTDKEATLAPEVSLK